MAHKLEIRPNLAIAIQFIFIALEKLSWPVGAVIEDGPLLPGSIRARDHWLLCFPKADS